jgi:homoserine kinase type II
VDGDRPPRRVLHDAGLVVLPGDVRPREGRAWLVGWQHTLGVLHVTSAPADPATMTRRTEDLVWLHRFLDRLAETGFPAPRPLPAFGGRSWVVADGALWELVSYLPGQVVGWADRPPMDEIGALLARYHATIRGVETGSQRPGALPLAEVPDVLRSPQLRAARLGPDQAAIICGLAEDLACDLDHARRLASPRVVIHGDFTNHNILCAGSPPKLAGVIDFAGAHAEIPLADIAYGLWRSGRPYQEADHLDLSRVRRFLRGYAGIARISADEAQLLPMYLRGRGLQMIAKRIRAGRDEIGMLPQVCWLSANAGPIADACAGAVA